MHPALPRPARCRTLAVAMLVACLASPATANPCPIATLQLFDCPPEEIAGPTASGSRSNCGITGGSTYHFRGYGDSLYFSCHGDFQSSTLTVRGSYRYLGPVPGTPVVGQAQFRIVASMHISGQLTPSPCSQTAAKLWLLQDQVVERSAAWQAQPVAGTDDQCGGSADSTFVIDCSHPAGTEFELDRQVELDLGSSFGGLAQASVRTSFVGLEPGAVVVGCDGDTAQVLGVGPGFASDLRIDTVQPNPARRSFRAALSLPAGGPTFVRLLDVSGRVVETRVMDASPGARRELTFGGGLPAGIYFLRASQGALTAVHTVVIRP